jgi:hypothetical protein
MAERKATEQEQEVLEYLNDLRDSGDTNMFGASPYVESRFGIDRNESRKLVSLWMNNFKEDGNYENIKD